MTWRRRLCICVWLAACVLTWAADPPAPDAPVTTKETVQSPEGLVTIWRRTPATEADFGLPFPAGVTATESFVYRTRDRKGRDLRRYVRAVFPLTENMKTMIDTYTPSLAADAKRGSDKDTGAVQLSDGPTTDTRVVTILPLADGCRLTLERAQIYPLPPRVYTAQEQRTLRVLADVTQTYQAAAGVSYRAVEAVQVPGEPVIADDPAALTWHVDLQRPDTLTVTATSGTTTRLRIITRDGTLRVTREADTEEVRVLDPHLTLDLLPELHDDPVARLLFSDDFAQQADTITLEAIPGVPPGKQQRLTLTYPDRETALALLIDLQQKTVLRAETTVTVDGRQACIIHTYDNLKLTPPVAPAPAAP
jgi:hypothetical protein